MSEGKGCDYPWQSGGLNPFPLHTKAWFRHSKADVKVLPRQGTWSAMAWVVLMMELLGMSCNKEGYYFTLQKGCKLYAMQQGIHPPASRIQMHTLWTQIWTTLQEEWKLYAMQQELPFTSLQEGFRFKHRGPRGT